ncbi:MAG: hypothetical protein PHH26_00235 [Candidatus Thermoplasmatota archaeon]|nr:hypothetical protein [Candidatus Thermoplasmatota archaeon]
MNRPQDDQNPSEGGKDSWEQTIVPDYEPPKQEKKKRPAGVTLVSVYLLVSGAFALLAGIIALAYPSLLIEYIREFGQTIAGAENITSEDILLFGWSMVIGSVLNVVLAIGLLKMMRWARFSVIALSTFEILSSLFSGFSAAVIIQSILPGIIVIYMLQPKVALAFSGRARQGFAGAQTAQRQQEAPAELQVKCPRCGTDFSVNKEHGGPTPIKCPKCGKEGMMP